MGALAVLAPLLAAGGLTACAWWLSTSCGRCTGKRRFPSGGRGSPADAATAPAAGSGSVAGCGKRGGRGDPRCRLSDSAGRIAAVSPRPRHQTKEIEALLRSLEAQGWRVTKGKGYFKAYCPCGLHLRTVHLTPSSAGYLAGLVRRLKRDTCWEEGRP